MASQIPMIVPNGYYDKLGATTIRTPIALERMLNGPILKINNPLWPMTNPPNKSANEADATGGRPLSNGASTMAGGFFPMGNVPEGYDSLINAARQQLVKLPDGTYTVAPQFGGDTNAISDLYKGIYPTAAAPAGPSTRVVQTTPVKPKWGQPNQWQQMASAPPVQAPPRPWQETFTEVTGQPLVAAPGPKQNFFDFLGGAFSNNTPAPTTASNSPPTAPKDETRLGYAGLLPYPSDDPVNPALEAIDDQLVPSGRSTLKPFPLMGFNRPRYQEPIDITVNGGKKMPPNGSAFRAGTGWGNDGFTYSWMNKDITAPSAAPKPAGLPPPITFKKGDTVSALAKKLGMTTSSFSDLYGISNPNKIYAGQTVAPRAPVMPRMPPAGLNRSPAPPVPRLPPQALNRARQIAEGKASQLDEFGNIR